MKTPGSSKIVPTVKSRIFGIFRPTLKSRPLSLGTSHYPILITNSDNRVQTRFSGFERYFASIVLSTINRMCKIYSQFLLKKDTHIHFRINIYILQFLGVIIETYRPIEPFYISIQTNDRNTCPNKFLVITSCNLQVIIQLSFMKRYQFST